MNHSFDVIVIGTGTAASAVAGRNRMTPYGFEQDLEAYRDWRRRHPTYRVLRS